MKCETFCLCDGAIKHSPQMNRFWQIVFDTPNKVFILSTMAIYTVHTLYCCFTSRRAQSEATVLYDAVMPADMIYDCTMRNGEPSRKSLGKREQVHRQHDFKIRLSYNT